MIEIGTNFFVETTIEKADKFCDRRIENLKMKMIKNLLNSQLIWI